MSHYRDPRRFLGACLPPQTPLPTGEFTYPPLPRLLGRGVVANSMVAAGSRCRQAGAGSTCIRGIVRHAAPPTCVSRSFGLTGTDPFHETQVEPPCLFDDETCRPDVGQWTAAEMFAAERHSNGFQTSLYPAGDR